MEKKEILKFVVCGIICLFLGVRIGMDGMVDSEKYEDLKDKHNKQVEINSDLMSNKEAIEKELADLKEKTKNYIELNETEKSIVDTKIQEVKRLTKEKEDSLTDTIKYHILDVNGTLYEEPNRLFMDDLTQTTLSSTLLSLVGNGVNRLSEIAGRMAKPSTAYLYTSLPPAR